VQLSDSLQQVWPPFVLVTGLLLIGLVANRDGLFERTGAALERMPGGTAALLAACLLLVAAVTAVLNLDTAVVFLTPVIVHAARGRRVDEEAFLYGAVFMANASSLYLPGSNLTNLLVLAHQPISGGAFAARMLAPALAATLATALGLFVLFAGALRSRGRERTGEGSERRGVPVLGVLAALAAAVLTILLRNPAAPVLCVGLVATAIEVARRRLDWEEVLRAIGPVVLVSLFLVSVALGVLAREWSGPSQLMGDGGRWGTAVIGALASIMINNLPAAVVLSAHPVAHPRALLVGLNVGPNLAASGSLSAFLWWRAARAVDARPSLAGFSRRGVPLAIFAMAMALLASSVFATAP
jgi:arsenical pump membrane protein